MKRTVLILIWGLTVSSTSCHESVAPEGGDAKARVLTYTCAGTVLQFIDSKEGIGEDWTYFDNIYPPHKSSDATVLYKHTVTGFGVPRNKEVVGDTLDISFQRVTQPPGPRCALGFGPGSLITITALKE